MLLIIRYMLYVMPRVSFETSFDSKQPKLEPKLVSALSEAKRLFRLFRFYTKTASFGVSIEQKQTEDQPNEIPIQILAKPTTLLHLRTVTEESNLKT